jgi:hypothetical protein
MSQDNSRLPDYMPRRDGAPKNILDLLGGAKKWDIEHSDVLDKEFVVLDVDPKHHMGKDVAICTVEIDNERKIMLVNSITLASQLLGLSAELPLVCKVGRKGKRYHFTA